MTLEYTYRLVRLIAEGGMGKVYEAEQAGAAGFRKRVAIKVLRPELASDIPFIELFMEEARLVADLVHENIVQIYQLARSHGTFFMVMEYVHGLPLREFIHLHRVVRKRPPWELAVFITSRIARGLAYAHSRVAPDGTPLNIVHRDVCPRNILITTEGLPKLTDFGVARAATSVRSRQIRGVVGKLRYVSPELSACCGDVDFRSDIYALGLILFELITLEKARPGNTREEVLAHARSGTVRWDALPPDLPDDVRRILRRMLALRPEDRYDSTDRLGYELEYAIYHSGYGPTVVTLEQYLRRLAPGLYRERAVPIKKTPGERLSDRTVVIPVSGGHSSPAASSPDGARPSPTPDA